MTNNTYLAADAYVEIDGEKVGVWRINPYDSTTIERPSQVNRKFTFVDENGSQANMAGIARRSHDNGVVKVKVKFGYDSQKYVKIDDIYMPKYNRAYCSSNSKCETYGITEGNYTTQSESLFSNDYSSGVTVLGQSSGQRFVSATPLKNVRDGMEQIIVMRLVVDNQYKPYVSLKDMNKVKVPPRIDCVSSGWFDSWF